jgi:hypothetical protein
MLCSVNVIASLSIYCIYLMHDLHHILRDHYDYLMMQNCLWQMVRTRTTDDDVLDIPKGSAPRGREHGHPTRGNAPPPPPHPLVSLEQLLATQNELMTLLIQNEARRGAERPQHPRYQNMNTSYSEFLVTHPPLFSGGRDPLEADGWLRTIESKFSLLNCIEYQKTLYAAQRSSRGLLGIIHRRTSSRPSCAMGQVPYRFPWPPPVSGHYAPQACGVSGSAPGKPFCL